MAEKLIITVHGIRTFGQWQERLGSLIKRAAPNKVVVENYHYGYFSVIAFLIPFFRWLATRRFRMELLRIIRDYPGREISLVSHSFGTHLVAWGLLSIPRAERPRIENVMLAGSVLRSGFPWSALLDEGSIKCVVNDCGINDGVLLLSEILVLLTGMAGRLGFMGMTGTRLVNRYFRGGHSHYFQRNGKPSDDFMARYWVPVLALDESPEPIDERVVKGLPGGLTMTLLYVADPLKFIAYACVLFAVYWFAIYGPRDRQQTIAVWQALAREAIREEAEGQNYDRAALLARQAFLFHTKTPREPRNLVAEALYRAGNEWPLSHTLEPYQATVFSVALSGDGARLASGSEDSTIDLWDLRRPNTRAISTDILHFPARVSVNQAARVCCRTQL